jgi:hypothetical protein
MMLCGATDDALEASSAILKAHGGVVWRPRRGGSGSPIASAIPL